MKKVVAISFVIIAYMVILFRSNEAFEYRTDNMALSEAVDICNSEVIQDIRVTAPRLYGVSIPFSNHGRQINGIVTVSLLENDEEIRKVDHNASYIADNGYQDFYFNRSVKIDRLSKYSLKISYFPDSDADVLAVYMGNSEQIMKLNGEVSEGKAVNNCQILAFENLKSGFLIITAILLVAIAICAIRFEMIDKLSLGRIIILGIVVLLLIEMVATDLFHRIVSDVSVYNSLKGNMVVIQQGEELETSFDSSAVSFDKIEFIAEGECIDNAHIKISSKQTGELLVDKDVSWDDVSFDANTGKNMVKVLARDTLTGMKVFPMGSYLVSISNLDNENELSVSAVDRGDGSYTLEVNLSKTSMLGYAIAIMVLFIMIFFILGLAYCTRRDDFDVKDFFLLSVIPLSLIYFMLFLPWSVPDTVAHFSGIYRLSNLMLGKGNAGAWNIRVDDHNFFNIVWLRAGFNPDMQDYVMLLHNKRLKAADTTLIDWADASWRNRIEYYSVFCYLPQVIGFSVGRLFKLGTVVIVYQGRACMLMVYIAACFHAIKNAPVGKIVFAAVALLPMSLMMSSSLSYDCMIIVSSICFVSSLLRLYKEKNDYGRILAECAFWAFIIGAVKGGGNLIFLPLVLILVDADRKETMKRILPVVLCGIGSVIIFDVIMPAGLPLFQFGGEPGYLTASYAIKNPVEYLDMCIQSYLSYLDPLLINMGGTSLAWVEGVIPNVIVIGLILVAGIFSVFENDDIVLNARDKWIMFAIVLVSFASTPMMLLSWNRIGNTRIEGMQGRYFLSVLPLLLLIVTKFKIRKAMSAVDPAAVITVKQTCFRLFGWLSCVAVYYILRLYLTRSII